MVGVLVIDLRLHRHTLGFFGARKLDAIEGVAVFDDLKRFNDAFIFQVLKESYHSVANIHFSFIASIFDTELFEHVGESDSQSQLFV